MSLHPTVASVLCLSLIAGCVQTPAQSSSVARGKAVYLKECAQCHGTTGEGGGPASLGLGVAPPDLTGLTMRNDGFFPREFVQRFVLGALEKDDPDAAMPDFGTVGLQHVYPDGGANAEVLTADISAMLDYLDTIQK